MQNINQTLDSQKTLHSSPSRASYGVSIVRILEKIDRVITAPHCMMCYPGFSELTRHDVHDTVTSVFMSEGDQGWD